MRSLHPANSACVEYVGSGDSRTPPFSHSSESYAPVHMCLCGELASTDGPVTQPPGVSRAPTVRILTAPLVQSHCALELLGRTAWHTGCPQAILWSRATASSFWSEYLSFHFAHNNTQYRPNGPTAVRLSCHSGPLGIARTPAAGPDPSDGSQRLGAGSGPRGLLQQSVQSYCCPL